MTIKPLMIYNMSWDLDLKKQAKHRFLIDVIQDVNSKSKGAGTVLILDEISAKIISEFVNYAELTENGIFVVENIHRQRKDYPTFRAIYFLLPDKLNLDAIEADCSCKTPKYGNFHLFFTKRLSDSDFAYVKSKSLAKKAKTIKEVNLHVRLHNDYLFEPYDEPNKLDVHLDALTSIISQIPNLESIEAFKLINPLYKEAATLYKALEPRVKELLPSVSQDSVHNLKIFIFERTFDLVTPLIHDFHYESLLVDILENTKLSQGTPDVVLKKFRHKFIRDCMLGIGNDFEKFLNENPIAKIQRNKDNKEVDIDKMGVVVRGITEYNEAIKTYEQHLDYVKKLDAEIGKRDANELADLEYTMITGIDNYGEQIETAKRVDMGQKFIDSLSARKLDQIRFLMILQGSLYKDVSSKQSSITDPKFRESFDNYIQLVGKYGKYWPEKDKDTLKKVVKGRYKAAESSLQRYVCKTEYLISNVLQNGRSEHFDSFKYGESKVGFSKSPNTLFKGKLNIGKAQTGGHNYAIVYFVGGVSYPEIAALKNLESGLGDSWTFLIGGDGMLSPKDFVDKVRSIPVGTKNTGIIDF